MKRFDGWVPRTFHEHDGSRLVSSWTESEWDSTERGWMLALRLWRDSRCPLCGRDIAECTASEYRVPLPVRCHAATAVAVARKPYDDSPQSEALMFQAERR